MYVHQLVGLHVDHFYEDSVFDGDGLCFCSWHLEHFSLRIMTHGHSEGAQAKFEASLITIKIKVFQKWCQFKLKKRIRCNEKCALVFTAAAAAVLQATSNAQDNANEIRDPVVEAGAAIEAGLDEFYDATKGRGSKYDR